MHVMGIEGHASSSSGDDQQNILTIKGQRPPASGRRVTISSSRESDDSTGKEDMDIVAFMRRLSDVFVGHVHDDDDVDDHDDDDHDDEANERHWVTLLDRTVTSEIIPRVDRDGTMVDGMTGQRTGLYNRPPAPTTMNYATSPLSSLSSSTWSPSTRSFAPDGVSSCVRHDVDDDDHRITTTRNDQATITIPPPPLPSWLSSSFASPFASPFATSTSTSVVSSSPKMERWRAEMREMEVPSMLDELASLQRDLVADRDRYDDDIECRREYAVRHYPNGDLFSGNVDVVTGMPIYGRMTHVLELEVYEGHFVDGERHGRCATCSKVDGSAKFLGRYDMGRMHSGTLIVSSSASQLSYTGTFANDDFHGMGTMAAGDGSIYQGHFANGLYHGIGTLRTVDAGRGNHGSGNAVGGRTESEYVGDFVEGAYHGHGKLTNSDGSSYVGSWHEGKRATGIETCANGDVFEGTFVKDLREGPGVLAMTGVGRTMGEGGGITKGGGMTICGVWEGGTLKIGADLCITYEDGRCYCGDHAELVPHGEFVLYIEVPYYPTDSHTHSSPPPHTHVPVDVNSTHCQASELWITPIQARENQPTRVGSSTVSAKAWVRSSSKRRGRSTKAIGHVTNPSVSRSSGIGDRSWVTTTAGTALSSNAG
jgi:hypothetical protein